MRTPTPLNTEAFEKYLQERLDLIKSVLSSKAAEYAVDNDRMHNFNVALRMKPELFKTREDAIEAFLTKHLTSVEDILRNLRAGKNPSLSLLQEKFGDVINYYILMEASIRQTIDLLPGNYNIGLGSNGLRNNTALQLTDNRAKPYRDV